MTAEDGVGAVAEMSRECRPRGDSIIDLSTGCFCVADRDDGGIAHHALDESRRLGPLGRERNDPDQAARGILPPPILVEIRLADPAARMRSARPVVGADERPFHMETGDRAAILETIAGLREIT